MGSGGTDVSAAGSGGASASGGSSAIGSGGTDAIGSGGTDASGGAGGANASGSGGAGGTNAGGGAGAGGAGGKGGAGGTAADASCNADDDCVLCVTPLSDALPCCAGCPIAMSQAQCDEATAAMEQCPPNDPLACPQILCVNPGTPSCQNNTCVSVDGFTPVLDPDCDACTRVRNTTVCNDAQPIQWECFTGFPSDNVIDNCTDLATAIPRYCCGEEVGSSCGDF
jgi:hypothetical protein